jgi:hypothetical protein
MRLHRKVWLWWGRWWAVQFDRSGLSHEFPVGLRPDWGRPMVDFYVGPFTIAFGRHAVYTDPRTRHWDSCRGMLFPDDAHWPLDPVEARVL